ncbi:MAG TPA: 3-carboxy-cis,cis-muconate cycloisomerase, partial [Paracoccus sp.]|nr:3-carboxy-cis,cis-muconate cycloisomerase [Paracoccus sp. (in: a-proteobacteria)]
MTLTDGLFGDEELGRAMGARAQIAAMLKAEAALARAQGRLGIIPETASGSVSETAENLRPDPSELAAGM